MILFDHFIQSNHILILHLITFYSKQLLKNDKNDPSNSLF